MKSNWRTMDVSDRRWEEDYFLAQRAGVLKEWPTGNEVDLGEALQYHKALPDHRGQAKRVARAKAESGIMILPQLGQALMPTMLEFIRFVEGQCGMSDWNDSWFLILDAYSRKKRFDAVDKAITASKAAGVNLLSGYPAVNHGVAGFRQLMEVSGHSAHLSTLDEDPRLCTEITLAGGASGYLSYDIHDVMQHSRDYPLDRRIHNHQYISRLAAYYTERGAPILAWPAGHNNGWEPPGIKLAMIILQALESARQGVKHIACSYGLMSNVNQDVAALRVVRRLLDEYLDKRGIHDVATYAGTYPHLGTWPVDVIQCSAQMAWEAAVSRMGGAHFVYLKSPDEASSTPSKEGIGAEVKIAKHMINILGSFSLGMSDAMQEEEAMLEMEVRAIVDAVLDLSDGDPSNGMIKAVERGILDAVFSPWVHVKNRLLTVRDNEGAYRYLDHGGLPLPAAVLRYNQSKIDARSSATGRKADIDMVTEDIYHLARPLGSHIFSKL
jgi:methylaspartate mutase epsilon subunit